MVFFGHQSDRSVKLLNICCLVSLHSNFSLYRSINIEEVLKVTYELPKRISVDDDRLKYSIIQYNKFTNIIVKLYSFYCKCGSRLTLQFDLLGVQYLSTKGIQQPKDLL